MGSSTQWRLIDTASEKGFDYTGEIEKKSFEKFLEYSESQDILDESVSKEELEKQCSDLLREHCVMLIEMTYKYIPA